VQNGLFVALDLATTPGRGPEILAAFSPTDRGEDRYVWR
jgi:hypothetical protein